MPRKPNEDNNFIERLHRFISQETNNFVEWAPESKGFIINDQKMFTNEILVRKFGIGRFDSFIRKLNKFGFKRSKISKAKIRFFHKQFTRDSKSIDKIKKLSKEEALPKHIKLRMMRQKLWTQSPSEQNNIETSQKPSTGANQPQTKPSASQNKKEQNSDSHVIFSQEKRQQHRSNQKQDIGIYLIKEPESRLFNLNR